MKNKCEWWLIRVTGYGEFAQFSTEAEAEEMRRHKARWEGGTGTKERISTDHPAVAREITRNLP